MRDQIAFAPLSVIRRNQGDCKPWKRGGGRPFLNQQCSNTASFATTTRLQAATNLFAPDISTTLQQTSSSNAFLLSDAAVATFTADIQQQPQTFEPVLNVPALGSTLFIMVMALLLRLRVNAIGNAAEKRMLALDTLREMKRQQLSNTTLPLEQVQLAVQNYKTALQDEEKLRTLLPGVRLRAPNNPNQSGKDQQAIRQFLVTMDDTTTTNESDMDTKQLQKMLLDNTAPYDEPSGFPVPVLVSLWTFIFASLITLFFFMNMTDSMANEVFNSLSDGSSGFDTFNNNGQVPASTIAESIGELMSNE
mgnify:CR=1 FL=1